ncbi:MAG: SGNH/GDSL hydrolase family protein [Ruminococcus sp.]|nr:SGNH/GDSL hydrolase family protein [Ruminococcus sp.]
MFYQGRRLKKKEHKIKSFLVKHLKSLSNASYIIMALILVFTYYFGNRNSNKKIEISSVPKSSYESLELPKEELLRTERPYIYDYEKNSSLQQFEGASNEVVMPDNLPVEIALLLEKHNLTYYDLINMISSNDEFRSLLNKYPNLSTDKLIDILKGDATILRETLYIGDSRTQGMMLSGAVSEDNTVYGVGYGYYWLVGNGEFNSNKTNALNGGIIGIQNKMAPNNSYDIVIWLGVNDYRYCTASTYFKVFKELAEGKFSDNNIHIVSVGPVSDSRATTVSNDGINNFNQELKSLVESSDIPNLSYIDLNFNESSIKGYDGMGLHYSASDYQNINSIITSNISKNYDNDRQAILSLFYKMLYTYDVNLGVIENNRMVRERGIYE